MNFGEFEAQPEFLLPKFRTGANSFEDLLVPFGGEGIVTVGKAALDSILEVLVNDDHADNILMVSMEQRCGVFVCSSVFNFQRE